MTTVVNIRVEKCEVYCGRPSFYGNPYRIGRDGTRVDVVAKYIDYFFDRLERDPWFKQKIFELKDKKIGCWCHPDLCHLHIIAHYLDNYAPIQTKQKTV